MALVATGIGEKGVRHSDPSSSVHARHAEEAKARRVIERVVVDVRRDDAAKLNALADEWEVHWPEWQGTTYLAEQHDFSFSGGCAKRSTLKECSGTDYTAAAQSINRLDWYWSLRRDKNGTRKAKRSVEKNRRGRVCDRHTVSLSPPQMRLMAKLSLSSSEAKEVIHRFQQNAVEFFGNETGRHVVGCATHADSGILHFDILSSRITPTHELAGEKSLPSLSNPAWTVAAFRQRQLGCMLSPTKSRWLEQNLARFHQRHPDRKPILLQLHNRLDADFEDWVQRNGHSQLWEQSKEEYREWVGRTEPIKQQWAEERASGNMGMRLAERAAITALRLVLPRELFVFTMGIMTVAQIASDLLALDQDPTATGLLLQTTLRTGMSLYRSCKKKKRLDLFREVIGS